MPPMRGMDLAPLQESPSPDGGEDLAPLPPVGLLHSAVAGRTDHLDVKTPPNSYVIPADVVSGIGEGNSLAGARILIEAHKGPGPYGKTIPKGPQRAHGGKADEETPKERVPIMAAGGEVVVSPQAVKWWWGGGDMKRGHDTLDDWVVAQRKINIKEQSKLPGPAKE